jgi:hypothetical protein
MFGRRGDFFRWFPWMDIAPNEEFWGVFYPAL